MFLRMISIFTSTLLRRGRKLRGILALVFLAVPCVTPIEALAQNNKTLPGGATSLKEAHSDWEVVCQSGQSDQILCAMSQQVFNSQTKQRLIGLEFSPKGDGIIEGLIVLPFGLKLLDGVELSLDDNSKFMRLDFSTCVPGGCIVPIRLAQQSVNALKLSGELVISALRDGGEPIEFKISLKGFTSAHSRLKSLM